MLQVAQRAADSSMSWPQRDGAQRDSHSSSTLYLIDKNGDVRQQVCLLASCLQGLPPLFLFLRPRT